MKAGQISIGSVIRSDGVNYIVTAIEPDVDVMTVSVVRLDRQERIFLHPNEQVGVPGVEVNSARITYEIATKVERRLEKAAERFGTQWTGNSGDVLDSLEEELLDALVYIWAHRSILKEATDGQEEKGSSPES